MEATTAIADAPTTLLEQDDDANAIDAELLIETVKDLPILWNTFLRGYKETNKKSLAWQGVSRKLGKDGKLGLG